MHIVFVSLVKQNIRGLCFGDKLHGSTVSSDCVAMLFVNTFLGPQGVTVQEQK